MADTNTGQPVGRVRFADLTLDLGRHQLFRGTQPIHLTKLDFELLRTLVAAAPNMVTREDLAGAVWGPHRVVTPENLYQRVMALRKHLNDEAREPRYIEGVRGRGYRLVPDVVAWGQGAASPAAAARPVDAARARLPSSVAVLPLANLSPDPQHAYFAAGVHAEIIDKLAKLKNVNAIARTSVQIYEGTTKPVSEIAAELGVETVLEGSARFHGNRVRVSVNLIEPSRGTTLWSESYERDLVDAFEIQTDIAANVASALRAELVGTEQAEPPRRPTQAKEAYELYMQALGLFVAHDTGEEFGRLLERALDFDPEFAEVHGLMAYWRAMSYIDTENDDAFDSAHRDHLEGVVRAYARRALAIDPGVAIAHAAAAVIDLVTWRWTAARRGFDKAHELGWSLDISPWLYSWLGQHDRAIARARHVVELSPHDWVRHRHLAVALAYSGQYDGALDVLRRTAAMSPDEWLTVAWILYVQVASGMNAEAVETAARIERMIETLECVHFVFLPELAYAYRRLGRLEDAERVLAGFQKVAGTRNVGTGAWAMASVAMGDHDAALLWLDKAAERIHRHTPDPSAINLYNLKMNFLADPDLESPAFVQRLAAIHGD